MRLFAALELPDDVVSALHDWAEESARGLRILPPASLHATLVFLGERPQDEVDAISSAVRDAAGPAPRLSLGRPAALGRGRALAIDLVDHDGACAALQGRLAASLAASAAYEPETRAYRPHVTVARGDRVHVKGLSPLPALAPFHGTAVTLFRSHLGRGGARYEALVSASLRVDSP